jgi:hypothetical protein
MLDKTTKETCLIQVAITNGHSLYSTINEKFQNYKDDGKGKGKIL